MINSQKVINKSNPSFYLARGNTLIGNNSSVAPNKHIKIPSFNINFQVPVNMPYNTGIPLFNRVQPSLNQILNGINQNQYYYKNYINKIMVN